MKQSEFETRVHMNVTAEEYSHIEEVYMSCDLDKDEFCKQWSKMNQSRIKKAKEEAKAKEAELIEILRNLKHRFLHCAAKMCCQEKRRPAAAA